MTNLIVNGPNWQGSGVVAQVLPQSGVGVRNVSLSAKRGLVIGLYVAFQGGSFGFAQDDKQKTLDDAHAEQGATQATGWQGRPTRRF